MQQRTRKNVHYETEMTQRWEALPLGCFLPLSDGRHYQLLFGGYRGGAAGPDMRDAVLMCADKGRLVGDIEFHIHASDWIAHQHDTDARYNQVILHVVYQCDALHPTQRQDGATIPICPLNDLICYRDDSARSLVQHWPCQHVQATLKQEAAEKLLMRAGLLRFERKSALFVESIHAHSQGAPSLSIAQHYTRCLLVAIAEGLGYGRDRAFFRSAGLYALTMATTIPEPLGRSPTPSHLDSERLRFLQRLVQDWWQQPLAATGWQQLLPLLLDRDLAALRLLFATPGLSLARTDILLCNVVLPFANAVALVEQQQRLAECATELYLAHPGLASNRITRMMTQQIGLSHEPLGSCQQQGLQHIYQETCREKLCHLCIVGRDVL